MHAPSKSLILCATLVDLFARVYQVRGKVTSRRGALPSYRINNLTYAGV